MSDERLTRVLLLFDEAEALFGTRSEVRRSYDRNATIEPDPLVAWGLYSRVHRAPEWFEGVRE